MTLKDLVPSLGKKRVPVRYDYSPFSLFHKDMDRLFEDLYSGFEIEPFGRHLSSFSTRIEVRDDKKEIKVTAELPGMDEKDIDISLRDNTLTVSGEKKEEADSNGKDFCLKERSYGSFRRVIPLHADIDTGKSGAHFKKGVLTITLPKSKKEIEKNKKVSVKVH